MKIRSSLSLASLVLFFSVTLFAQAPDTLWTHTFGGSSNDEGYSVQHTTDSGYIITGSTLSFGAGSGDVWLLKTDSNGDTLWTKTFGGNDADGAISVQQTTDGGYFITGYTNSFGAGYSDIWLLKTNDSGDTLWTKTIGGSYNEGVGSGQQTSDGGYIITGYTDSFGPGYLLLLKTDSYGNTLWTRNLGGGIGGSGKSVKQTTDGGYIITGYIYSSGTDGSDISLIRTTHSGDTLWNKTFGGSGSDEGYSVQQTSDGGYIIAGLTTSFGAGGSDVWLIRTDANGDTLFTKTLGTSYADAAYSVQQTFDGGYIVVGSIGRFTIGLTSDMWLIKVAPKITTLYETLKANINNHRLQQNYPNPFNPITDIGYQISDRVFVSLKVYNVLGKEVAMLVNEEKPAGEYTLEFDASTLLSGIYFYKLKAGDFKVTKKMILMRYGSNLQEMFTNLAIASNWRVLYTCMGH